MAAVVGVPLSAFALRVMPAGSVPDVTAVVYGLAPPVVLKALE